MQERAATYARVGRDLCESGQRLIRGWTETCARVDTDCSDNERRTFPSFPFARESIFSYLYNPSPAKNKPPRYANSPLPPHSPRELAAVPAKTHRISRRHSRANGNPSSLNLPTPPRRGTSPKLRQYATPTALPTRTGRSACENSPHFPPSFPCKRESIFS